MDYNEACQNVQHHVGNSLASLISLINQGELTEINFQENVRVVICTLEKLLSEKLEGFPYQPILEANLKSFRIGYERLRQVKYPNEVDESIKIMRSLTMIIPSYEIMPNLQTWDMRAE